MDSKLPGFGPLQPELTQLQTDLVAVEKDEEILPRRV